MRQPLNNLQVIEELCNICTAQAEIIKAQSNALEQQGAAVMEEERAKAGKRLAELI